MPAVLAKMLAAKILTVTVGAANATAVAVTAATGALPAPVQEAAHQLVGAPAPTTPAAAEPDETETETATETESPAPESMPEAAPPVQATDAHPSFVGLCHAYSSGNKATHGKALQSPAFLALVTAAGGEGQVVSFCTPLLAKASPQKTHPAKVSTHKPAEDKQHGKPVKAAKHDKRAKAGHAGAAAPTSADHSG
jgi:hypothetical protein